ncbi:hypothetical protein D9M69_690610 [compost metagenome]
MAETEASPCAAAALRSTGAPSTYIVVSCDTGSLTIAMCTQRSAMTSPDQLVLARGVPAGLGTTSHCTSRRLEMANSIGGASASPRKPGSFPLRPSRVMMFIHLWLSLVQALSIFTKASTV